MDKPLLCAAIVLLWIMSLVTYFAFSLYQVRYDRDGGIAVVVDKWRGTVQTVPLKKQNAVSERAKKTAALGNDVKDRQRPKERSISLEVIEGIQNKEP